MSRIRSIHPGLTTDDTYMAMSMTCKAAWPLLWMECDDAGLFEWKPLTLKAKMFPADNVDMVSVLGEFMSLGCVMKAEVGGAVYGAVRNFCRFQRPKLPKFKHPQTDELRKFAAFSEPPGAKNSPIKKRDFRTSGEKSPQRGGEEEEGTSPTSPEENPGSGVVGRLGVVAGGAR